MTSDDLDTWRISYSQFAGADSESGIIVTLSNVPEAQDSCKVRQNNGRNGLRKRSMTGVTLRDLDSISLSTINAFTFVTGQVLSK